MNLNGWSIHRDDRDISITLMLMPRDPYDTAPQSFNPFL
jgi:hypothetical protein